MECWKAREIYDEMRADPSTSKDQIREAGVHLLQALRKENREIPYDLADEIIDANHTTKEVAASGVG